MINIIVICGGGGNTTGVIDLFAFAVATAVYATIKYRL